MPGLPGTFFSDLHSFQGDMEKTSFQAYAGAAVGQQLYQDRQT
jgi:hypothetical protein